MRRAIARVILASTLAAGLAAPASAGSTATSIVGCATGNSAVTTVAWAGWTADHIEWVTTYDNGAGGGSGADLSGPMRSGRVSLTVPMTEGVATLTSLQATLWFHFRVVQRNGEMSVLGKRLNVGFATDWSRACE